MNKYICLRQSRAKHSRQLCHHHYFYSVPWLFSLTHVPPANMEEVGLTAYTAASHQGATEMFWLHFSSAVIPSIFIYSLWTQHIGWHSSLWIWIVLQWVNRSMDKMVNQVSDSLMTDRLILYCDFSPKLNPGSLKKPLLDNGEKTFNINI